MRSNLFSYSRSGEGVGGGVGVLPASLVSGISVAGTVGFFPLKTLFLCNGQHDDCLCLRTQGINVVGNVYFGTSKHAYLRTWFETSITGSQNDVSRTPSNQTDYS